MEKNNGLKLNDILGYFPHKLLCEITLNSEKNNTAERFRGYWCGMDEENLLFTDENFYLPKNKMEIMKIFLNPETDLYENYLYKGENIIPILELAKIADPDRKWEKSDEFPKQAISYGEDEDDNVITHFGWATDFFYKFSQEKVSQTIFCEYVRHQSELFDFMNELKIDYRGLIKKGWANKISWLEISFHRKKSPKQYFVKKDGLIK
jgi:hypothetical protein